MTSASITPLRFPLTTHICTACRTRYAMYQDPLCGACAEEAEEPGKTYCKACNAVHGTYTSGNSGRTVRVQILGNGYCRACFDKRKARA
jgi:hypothetical protein